MAASGGTQRPVAPRWRLERRGAWPWCSCCKMWMAGSWRGCRRTELCVRCVRCVCALCVLFVRALCGSYCALHR